MAFLLFIWFVTILVPIFTMFCTEFVFDCSVYTNHQFIVIGMGVSLFIHIIARFKKNIANILCFFTSLLVYGLIYYLLINRQLVFKYVVNESFKIKHPANDDIFVYYVLSNIKNDQKVIDIKLEFDKFILKTKSEIEKRSKDKCVVIEHDFTNIGCENVIEYDSFCKSMDDIHFSKFGSKICFVLKVSGTYIKNTSQINLSESEKTQSKPKTFTPPPPPPTPSPTPPPAPPMPKSNNSSGRSSPKSHENNKQTEDGSPSSNDLRFQLNNELLTKIEERNRKKKNKN